MIKLDPYMNKWLKENGYPKNHIRIWTTEQKLKLINLIEVKKLKSWFWISKDMKRSSGACKSMYREIRKNREIELKEREERVRKCSEN